MHLGADGHAPSGLPGVSEFYLRGTGCARSMSCVGPEARTWEELGDNSLSDIWSLRFLWNTVG